MTPEFHRLATIAALEAAAKAATPGPWRRWSVLAEGQGVEVRRPDGKGSMDLVCVANSWDKQGENAAYIALANPTAVLALIDRLRKLEAVVAAPVCGACSGKGRRYKECSYCGDSTYDHVCNDAEVPCDCAHSKALAALEQAT